jgi:hypothetical protein
MIVQFIRNIPRELDDAAAIDGCNEFGISGESWSADLASPGYGGDLLVLFHVGRFSRR